MGLIKGNAKAKTKDAHFNPYRVPRTDPARAIVAEVLKRLCAADTRKRARRPADQAAFLACVTALTCDTTHHRLSGKAGGVAITRSKANLGSKSRYTPAAMCRSLPAVIDRMVQLGLVRLVLGVRSSGFGGGKRSTITAGPRLVRMIRRHGLTPDDLGRDCGEEVLIMKGPKKGRARPRLEYQDTDHPSIVPTRERVQQINSFIRDANLDFDDGVLKGSGRVDVGERTLQRHYSRGSWSEGGRLFGGFWYAPSKQERYEGLIIDGESVVEVDYSGMGPRLLYAIANSVPTFDDPYALPGMVDKEMRAGIKVVFGAAMFASGETERIRFPKGSRKAFHPSMPYRTVADAIALAHPAIAHLLGTDIGHSVTYRESEIMIDLLIRLQSLGIVALPVHDAVWVKAEHAEQVALEMGRVTIDHLGFPIPVSIGKLERRL